MARRSKTSFCNRCHLAFKLSVCFGSAIVQTQLMEEACCEILMSQTDLAGNKYWEDSNWEIPADSSRLLLTSTSSEFV
jgi:hypothetical protein